MIEEQGRRKEKRLHAGSPDRTCGAPIPGPSTWATWEFQTSLFQGKGVTSSRSCASAPRPSVKDRATTESPRHPTILLVTLVLYPSVVTLTSYRHSTGGRVKSNVAAASCDSVGDNSVNQRYHCHGCDPIRANPDVSLNNSVVVLIVYEGWGERFLANPLYNRSDRKSETPWAGREVSMRRVNQFCTAELEGRSEPGFRPSISGDTLPLTAPPHSKEDGCRSAPLRSTDTPLVPPTGVRRTPGSWPAIPDGATVLHKITESLHGRSRNYHSVFLRVRHGWIRWTYGHPATPTWDILPSQTAIPPARTSSDTGYHYTDFTTPRRQCSIDCADSSPIAESPVMECVGRTSGIEEDGTVGGSPRTDCLSRMTGNNGIGITRGNRRPTPGRSFKEPWLWRGLAPRCHDLNSVAVLLYEQNNLVSPLLCPQTHLFSPHTDSFAIDTLWLGRTTRLLCHSNRGWETEEPIWRTPRVLGLASILPRPTTTALTLPPSPCSAPQPRSSIAEFRLLSLESMHLHACICALLLGSAITSSADLIHRSTTLGFLSGLLSVTAADRFTLRNGYGTVEAQYHLMAYDSSDPSEVQAYSSIPASHCIPLATPVRKDRPTRFQLLQKEKKRYITAYVCFLSRTDITIVECTDTRNWTPCTGLFRSHSG